jgi:hypothetical protein
MAAILKGILVLCVAVYAFALSQGVRAADRPDLEGAELQSHGICLYDQQQFSCAVYEKDGVKYLLYAGRGEILLIYRIKDGATQPYGPNDTLLLWAKEAKKTEV